MLLVVRVDVAAVMFSTHENGPGKRKGGSGLLDLVSARRVVVEKVKEACGVSILREGRSPRGSWLTHFLLSLFVIDESDR